MDKTLYIDKKSLLYILIVILAFFAAVSLIIWALLSSSFENIVLEPQKTKEEILIESQLRELDRIRQDLPELTQEQLENQIKELDKIRENQPALSEAQIQRQLEELDKIRQQQYK